MNCKKSNIIIGASVFLLIFSVVSVINEFPPTKTINAENLSSNLVSPKASDDFV